MPATARLVMRRWRSVSLQWTCCFYFYFPRSWPAEHVGGCLGEKPRRQTKLSTYEDVLLWKALENPYSSVCYQNTFDVFTIKYLTMSCVSKYYFLSIMYRTR